VVSLFGIRIFFVVADWLVDRLTICYNVSMDCPLNRSRNLLIPNDSPKFPFY